MIGDYYFQSWEWADAVRTYANVIPLSTALSPERSRQVQYRYALSLLKTGYFREARPIFRSLLSSSTYEDPARFYIAYIDYIEGDLSRAYDGFSRVTLDDPDLLPEYFMAQIEYRRGQYAKSLTRAKELLSRGPSRGDGYFPELRRIAGLSLFKLGDPDAARPYLDRYMEFNKAPADDAVYALAIAEYNDGRYDKAESLFSRLTDNGDELAQSAWLFLGQCRLAENDPTGAAMAFEKAAAMGIDKDVTEAAWFNYATAATRGAHIPFASGAKRLEEFVRRYPDSDYTPKVETYLANAYYNEGDYDAALKAIGNVRHPSAELLGTKQKVLYELGVRALSNGDPKRAANYLDQAVGLERYGKDVAREARLWLGDALYASGDFRRAADAYEKYAADSAAPSRALAYYNLGYARYKAGSYAAAAKAFRNATLIPGLTPAQTDDATLRRADCLYYTRNYREAADLFASLPASDYALYRRAILEGLQGNAAAKERLLLQLESSYPDSRWLSPALLELALSYEGAGNKAAAADAYRRRLNAASDVSVDELMRMAETMHDAARWSDLHDVVRRLRESGALGAEDLADIDLFEADAFNAEGSPAKAIEIYERLALNPESLSGAKAAVALGQLLLDSRDYSRAEQLMTDFTDAGTPHQYWLARGFIILADAYAAQDKAYLAKEYLESLRDNYPGQEPDIFNDINSRLKSLK